MDVVNKYALISVKLFQSNDDYSLSNQEVFSFSTHRDGFIDATWGGNGVSIDECHSLEDLNFIKERFIKLVDYMDEKIDRIKQNKS